jgi:hypothetical protein
MKTIVLFATIVVSLLLVGCEERYRYPCQDEANKEHSDCVRPACEVTGFCYDTLNGIEPPQVFEESADCNCETTGE